MKRDFRKYVDDRKCRLTADEEREVGKEILEAEAATRQAVRALPEAHAALSEKASRRERTRAGSVDRLALAVRLLDEASRADAKLRPAARQARGSWARAEGLRWKLALSARYVAGAEARKIGEAHLNEEDLVSEGFIGLLRAAKRFDPERGIRFATYARWWARAQMTRAIDTGGRRIRLTGCAVEQLRSITKARRLLEKQPDEYTLSDLASEAGLTVERVQILLTQQHVVSLDAPLDEGPEAGSRHDLLEDDETPSAAEQVMHREELDWLRDVLDRLPSERQRHVLLRRYGLVDGETRTLAAVGAEMGISRERVRQIERQALDWIREQLGSGTRMPRRRAA